jgi:protoheme IX farnesyltransferase
MRNAAAGIEMAAPRLSVSRTLGLSAFADLTKLRIVSLSTLSAVSGYVIYARRFDAGVLTCGFGVLLTAMGAAVLNQFQDRELDARMIRTQNRPIPAGILNPHLALIIGLVLVASGGWSLWAQHNRAAALIALGAAAWYNLLYTYLKRIWAFAVVPGAVIGALPPVIGWTAAGGSPVAPHIVGLAFFFFMWQVPHFWLLLFRFGEEYSRAGLPSLTALFSARQFTSVTGAWMLATGATGFLLPVFLPARSPWVICGLLLSGLWLMWEAFRLLQPSRSPGSLQHTFRRINLYALVVMCLLVADAFV